MLFANELFRVDGTYQFSVRATDKASNTDQSPAEFSWTIDTIQPTVVSTIPSHDATEIKVDSQIEITFSEPVVIGQNFSLEVRKLSSGELISGTTTPIVILNAVKDLVFVPASKLEYATISTVLVSAEKIADPAGNPLEAYSFSFKTEPLRWAIKENGAIKNIAVDKITGELYVGGIIGAEIFVAKLNADGTESWFKKQSTIGYKYFDNIYFNEQKIYIEWRDNDMYGIGGGMTYVSNYNSDGTLNWTTIGQDGKGHGLVANNGNVFMGFSDSGYRIMKLDSNGMIVADINQSMSDIVISHDLNIVGCSNSGDIFTAMYDFDLNKLWQKTWGTQLNDCASSLAISPTSIYVAGSAGSDLLNNIPEIKLILKYDFNGNLLWARDDYGLGSFRNIIADDNFLYVSDTQGNISKIQAENGNIVWSQPVYLVSFTIFNNTIYGVNETNSLIRLETETGNPLQ